MCSGVVSAQTSLRDREAYLTELLGRGDHMRLAERREWLPLLHDRANLLAVIAVR
jgi:hypothetical protein